MIYFKVTLTVREYFINPRNNTCIYCRVSQKNMSLKKIFSFHVCFTFLDRCLKLSIPKHNSILSLSRYSGLSMRFLVQMHLFPCAGELGCAMTGKCFSTICFSYKKSKTNLLTHKLKSFFYNMINIFLLQHNLIDLQGTYCYFI